MVGGVGVEEGVGCGVWGLGLVLVGMRGGHDLIVRV